MAQRAATAAEETADSSPVTSSSTSANAVLNFGAKTDATSIFGAQTKSVFGNFSGKSEDSEDCVNNNNNNEEKITVDEETTIKQENEEV